MKYTLLLSLFSLLCCLSLENSELTLIIALPQTHAEVSASWERGEDILPGALAAVEEAKNHSLSFNLTVVKDDSGHITRNGLPYKVLEVITNLTRQKTASDNITIGIAGVLLPNVLAAFNKIQQLHIASLVCFTEPPQNLNIHYMTASISILTDSILAFLKEISPKKIEIIAEIKQPYYLMVSNEISAKVNTSLNQNVHINNELFSVIADRIFASNAHVILLSVGPSTAIPMLCEAYKRGLTWPKYAWILHSYRLDDLLQSSESNEGCSVQKILEGIFVFQLTKEESNFNPKSAHHNMYINPYADLLYDSVRSLISFAENRSSSHFNSHFNHESSKVYIYHNINGMASLNGIFDGTSHTLTATREINFTDYDLPVVYRPASLVPYLLPLPVISFAFNTILLILYIVFRNEPNIKSTSVSLSVMIFIGCYILIAFILVVMLSELYPFDQCMLQIWLSGLSISLILATTLIKMLRVYHIFTALKRMKRSAHRSDFAHFIYTMFVILPNIVILIMWTSINPYRKVFHFIEHPGFINIEVTCYSEYELVFYGLGFVYFFALSTAVIIVAIKSRKIRLIRFKDTKQVNLFIFILYLLAICTFSYWYILLYAGLYFASIIIVCAGHLFAAFTCQITLFVPKVWPSIRKKIFKSQDTSDFTCQTTSFITKIWPSIQMKLFKSQDTSETL